MVLPPNEVQLFDLVSGQELIRLHPPARHLLTQPAFSPDDRFLAVTSTDHRLLIWSLADLRSELARSKLDWASDFQSIGPAEARR